MSGFDAVAIKSKARAAAQRALYEAGEMVAGKSLEQVPRDTGELAKSIYVQTESQANKISCEIGYKAQHAPYVHVRDNTIFLEKPFMDSKNKCNKMIINAVEEAVR